MKKELEKTDEELARMNLMELQQEVWWLNVYGKNVDEAYFKKVKEAETKAWFKDYEERVVARMPKILYAPGLA